MPVYQYHSYFPLPGLDFSVNPGDIAGEAAATFTPPLPNLGVVGAGPLIFRGKVGLKILSGWVSGFPAGTVFGGGADGLGPWVQVGYASSPGFADPAPIGEFNTQGSPIGGEGSCWGISPSGLLLFPPGGVSLEWGRNPIAAGAAAPKFAIVALGASFTWDLPAPYEGADPLPISPALVLSIETPQHLEGDS